MPDDSRGQLQESFSPYASGGHTHEKGTLLADSTWAATPPAVDPSRAMAHSFLLPGWGQFNNRRHLKAALFIAAEAVCIGGFLYYNGKLDDDGRNEWERGNIRTDRNTFVIYWLATKLLGMVDAYVDAQMAGFDVSDITPPELKNDTVR
ncbi:MAG: hypothetical protein J7M24_08635 [Candidatus Latescibacteria bacterium]|nr:hypothetical protein [Candidatus Latescibacterota bacterium]